MAQPLDSIEPLLLLLDISPLGVFSDIDGTLAPIVARPEEARVSPRCRELLEALVARGICVALVTGRPLDVAREMTGVEGAVFAANHGLELWIDGHLDRPPGIEPYVEASRAVIEQTRIAVPGVTVEDKGPVLAFHYRNALNETAARAAILDAIGKSRAAEMFEIHEGRKVIELRPHLHVNKGTALAELAARLGVRSIVCMGDDMTDVDMFRAVASLRDDGTPAAIVAVDSPEAASEVLGAADYSVKGVTGVEWLLGELVSAIR